MKKQLHKKHKIMIGVGAGLLGAAAVTTPLVVMSTKHTTQYGFDNMYGLDQAQYNKMKINLLNAYSAELDVEKIADKEARLAMLTKQFNGLDNAVKKVRATKSFNTYFCATSALLNITKDINKGLEKGVVLTRESRANWNEVQEMFNGMVKSFKTYMTNHFFDRDVIDEIITKATESYDQMINNLKENYSNDILGGVLKAKTQLISCFANVNAIIASLSGTMRLNEFMANYSFTFKNASDGEANRLNKLVSSKKLVVDSVIDASTMNAMFECYNKETRQSAQFSEDMIPGYKLFPVFKGVESNAEKNEHSAKIDWTIVSNYYVNTNDEKAATAHLVDANEDFIKEMNQDDCVEFDDVLAKIKNHIKITNYSMLNTSTDGVDSEHNQLMNTYFNAAANNGASIKLYFKDGDAWYDGFMFADQTKFGEPQTITMQQLSYTGIRITDGTNDYSLKELINIVNQDNYEPKNLAEKFVKYCDLNDTITLTNDQTNGVVIVTSQFNAWYRNEEQWQQHGQSNSSAYTLPDKLEAKDLPLSPNFFGTINANFNKAYKDSHVFFDQQYDSMDKTAYSLLSLAVVFSISVDAMLISSIVYTIVGIAKRRFLRTLAGFGACTLTGLLCTATNLSIKHLREDYYKPISKYAEKSKEFERGDWFDTVKNKLDEDVDNFALVDEDGHIDPEEYNKKLQAFKKTMDEEGTQWAKDLFDEYNNFEMEGGIGYEFFEEARRLEIDPISFEDTFGDWKPSAALSLASLACDGISIGVFAALRSTTENLDKVEDAADRLEAIRLKREHDFNNKCFVIEKIEKDEAIEEVESLIIFAGRGF